MSRDKINLKQPILNLNGKEARKVTLSDKQCKECKQRLPITDEVFTLKDALVQCLVNKLVDPKTRRQVPYDAEATYNAVRLAMKIEDTDEISLNVEQIVDLKARAHLALMPIAMVRVWDILDPQEE